MKKFLTSLTLQKCPRTSMRRKLPRSPWIKSTNQKLWTPPYPSRSRQTTWINVFTHVLKSMHSNYFLWENDCILFIWEGLLVCTKVWRPCIFKIPCLNVVLLSIFSFLRERERVSLHINVFEPHLIKYIIECAQLNRRLYMAHYEECVCQNT